MKMRNHKFLTRVTVFLLLVSMVLPVFGSAAVVDPARPYASYYLNAYSGYIADLGGGTVAACFSARGTTTMDELGAMRIVLEESTDGSNWYTVRSYHYSSYSSLMGYNKVLHSGSVTYNGVSGRYYRAYITIWGGKDGGGDTRYLWTGAKRAS